MAGVPGTREEPYPLRTLAESAWRTERRPVLSVLQEIAGKWYTPWSLGWRGGDTKGIRSGHQ